jgi:hypothetical protein
VSPLGLFDIVEENSLERSKKSPEWADEENASSQGENDDRQDVEETRQCPKTSLMEDYLFEALQQA